MLFSHITTGRKCNKSLPRISPPPKKIIAICVHFLYIFKKNHQIIVSKVYVYIYIYMYIYMMHFLVPWGGILNTVLSLFYLSVLSQLPITPLKQLLNGILGTVLTVL